MPGEHHGDFAMPPVDDSQPGRWPTDDWDTYPPRRWRRLRPQAGPTLLKLAIFGATLLALLWLADRGGS